VDVYGIGEDRQPCLMFLGVDTALIMWLSLYTFCGLLSAC